MGPFRQEHYPQALHFDGEHQLNDHTFLWALLPVIQWIDDKQEGRSKRSLMVEMDGVLRDVRNDLPIGEAFKVFHKLSEMYDTYIVCRENPNKPELWGENVKWAEAYIGVPAWNRVIVGNHPELLMGDVHLLILIYLSFNDLTFERCTFSCTSQVLYHCESKS